MPYETENANNLNVLAHDCSKHTIYLKLNNKTHEISIQEKNIV